MELIAVAVNHHTAPIEIRESLFLQDNEIRNFIRELQNKLAKESCIISTCNRTEIYCVPKISSITYKEIQKFLLENKKVDNISESNFRNYFSCGAVNHLFHIAAGIDSLVIGDQQILGQVKDAFTIANEENAVGTYLQKVFQSALKVGKRVKTETELFEGPSSISAAAVQLAGKIFSDLKKKKVLVIGAGETSRLTLQNLQQKNVKEITITNRTQSRAEALANEFNAKVISFLDLKDYLHEYDIIISATSSPEPLVKKSDILRVMSLRKNQPLCILDIAIPRDFEPSIREIDNVFYSDIDALQSIVNQNLEKRQSQIPRIKKIIMEELIELFSWHNSLQISPVLKSLREQFEQIRQQEFEFFKNKFPSEQQENLELLTKRIINKLLHNPTIYLRKTADTIDTQGDLNLRINIIKEMFNLIDKNNHD
ncbi:MAG: glutamyl-tRNA reductase [Ignavibacteria bacterium]